MNANAKFLSATAMSTHPSAAISCIDGEITIDAELLAPKLGLSVAALKIEMRSGSIDSVAEAGIEEDAGRTRVTFRYRTRAWTAVIEPDGSAVEKIAPMWMPRQRAAIV